MKSLGILPILLVCCFLGICVSSANSQTPEPLPKPKRNCISIVTRLPTFFDGNALWNPGISGRSPWNLGWGMEYQRHLDAKNGFLLSAGLYGKWYSPPKGNAYGADNDWGKGVVYERSIALFEADYVRSLVTSKRFEVSALAGINFRLGYEGTTGWFWAGQDAFSGGYTLRDFAVVIGSRASLMLPWNFQLTTDLRFAEYLYRYDRHREDEYNNYAGKGATRHMLTAQLGLGYRF